MALAGRDPEGVQTFPGPVRSPGAEAAAHQSLRRSHANQDAHTAARRDICRKITEFKRHT